MREELLTIAGLETVAVGSQDADSLVVLLHGFSMTATDLSPFARSLGVPALFLFPQGPKNGYPTGRAWFEMDMEARHRERLAGPRDLVGNDYPGVREGRAHLHSYLQQVRALFNPHRLVLGGFSQGGMISCDAVLHDTPVDALLLLSASRLNYADWQAHQERLRALPVLVSHGESDAELAFSAGVGLKDFVIGAGATITWVPFQGGHEIPLVVWRAVRGFLKPFTSG